MNISSRSGIYSNSRFTRYPIGSDVDDALIILKWISCEIWHLTSYCNESGVGTTLIILVQPCCEMLYHNSVTTQIDIALQALPSTFPIGKAARYVQTSETRSRDIVQASEDRIRVLYVSSSLRNILLERLSV